MLGLSIRFCGQNEKRACELFLEWFAEHGCEDFKKTCQDKGIDIKEVTYNTTEYKAIEILAP